MFYFYRHFKSTDSTPFHTFLLFMFRLISYHLIFQFLHLIFREYTCLHQVKNWVYFYFPGSPRIINTADTIINYWHSFQYNSRPMLICSLLVFEWSVLYGVPFVHNNWPIIGQELYSLLVCMRLCVDILLNELIYFNRTASKALNWNKPSGPWNVVETDRAYTYNATETNSQQLVVM